MYAFANKLNVYWCTIWSIWNTNSARQVNKTDLNTQCLVKLNCDFEYSSSKRWIVTLLCHVACQERVDTKLLNTHFLKSSKCLKELSLSHSVLSLTRVAHDCITNKEISAWIVSAANLLWNATVLCKEINMCNIVQVDNCSQLACLFELNCRCLVGREHNVLISETYIIRKLQLCVAGTVCTTTLLLQNLQDKWVWTCLNCEILSVSLVP